MRSRPGVCVYALRCINLHVNVCYVRFSCKQVRCCARSVGAVPR